ncbi:MAG: pantoate--beta-alanine ligase [Omnitrophica WOR_2 bacterium RIFCSPHIGHO2_02_FULL_68_15]|nr:MAG: pantoate--beta-alanine ligase [Omnitrophica WOR_2 bacterium RIFCSPHIGHO2_02_FULL_68_15]
MNIIRSPRQMQAESERLRRHGVTVGFVPTMGALHAGHLALLARARRETHRVVLSIFVNPAQFNQRRDFATYPRPFVRDAALARRAGVDLLFAPAARGLYPPGHQTIVEVPDLARRWEGTRRPGHFRGVATIVTKLLTLVRPTATYVGEKDAQQARIIQQLVEDLSLATRVVIVPTVREPDGLAMSSRNVRLSPTERRDALVVFHALQAARRLLESGERRRSVVVRRMQAVVARAPSGRLEYAAVVDPRTLEPVKAVRGPVRLLIAAWIGRTRLIDTLRVRCQV